MTADELRNDLTPLSPNDSVQLVADIASKFSG